MGHHEIARACGEEPLCAGAPACYRVAPHAFELSQKWAPEKGPWELAELNFRVPAHLFANNEFIPPSKARMVKIGERFNPQKRFCGSYVPEAIYKYRGLSPGAKLIYGRLCRYAG